VPRNPHLDVGQFSTSIFEASSVGYVALTAQSFLDMAFGGCGFGNQDTKSFRYVFHKPFAHRALAIDKSPDGPLIYTKTPRGCWNSSKHLDAMREMISQFLKHIWHCSFVFPVSRED
jgi:hypothetical protein